MKLLEVFDQPYRFKSIEMAGMGSSYDFVTEDGTAYTVGFMVRDVMFGPTVCTVMFGTMDPDTGMAYTSRPDKHANPFKVLGTVVATMRDFLRRHPQIRTYHFSIDKNIDKKGSLEQVYNKMMDRLVPAGWDVKFKPTGSNHEANYVITLPKT